MIGADLLAGWVYMFLGQILLSQTKEFFDHELISAVLSITHLKAIGWCQTHDTVTNTVKVAMAIRKWNMLMDRKKKSYYTELTLKNFVFMQACFWAEFWIMLIDVSRDNHRDFHWYNSDMENVIA